MHADKASTWQVSVMAESVRDVNAVTNNPIDFMQNWLM